MPHGGHIPEHHGMDRDRERAAELPKRFETTGLRDGPPSQAEFMTSDGQFYLAKLFTRAQFNLNGHFLHNCLRAGKPAHEDYLKAVRLGHTEIFTLCEVKGGKPVAAIRYNVPDKKIIEIKAADNDPIMSEHPLYKEIQEVIAFIDNGTAYDSEGNAYTRGLNH